MAPTTSGPRARAAVGGEFLRALGGLMATPFRMGGFLLSRERLRAGVREDLEQRRAVVEERELAPPLDRPLHIFISCAEASGELHARSLVKALRSKLEAAGAPEPRMVGLGGERLAAEGVELLERPVERAAMGFDGILSSLPYYMRTLMRTAEHFRNSEPDLFLPVDSPALHVPMAHIAKRYGVPVVHFITPQYWGWAPWRVSGYRRAVDRALTILPFEASWFERHGVRTAHVGHPLLDDQDGVQAGARESLESQSETPGRSLVLLPGSRESVVRRNLPWMLATAARLKRRHPELEVVIAHALIELGELLAELVRASGHGDLARVETGDLHASLRRARAALSVSGTVLLDLLKHRLPAVVVYRLERRREVWGYQNLLTTPYFSSVNLLAGRAVLPEFCFRGEGPQEQVERALESCYADERWRADCRTGLELAARRLGPPGAARRAASEALALACEQRPELLWPPARPPASGPGARSRADQLSSPN